MAIVTLKTINLEYFHYFGSVVINLTKTLDHLVFAKLKFHLDFSTASSTFPFAQFLT